MKYKKYKQIKCEILNTYIQEEQVQKKRSKAEIKNKFAIER